VGDVAARPFRISSIARFNACAVTPASASTRAAAVPVASANASSNRSAVTN
jgi:hypothetical protein